MLPVRGPDPHPHLRAVGQQGEDLPREGGKGLSQAEAKLPAIQAKDQAVGQDKDHGGLPARKDALMKMVAGRIRTPYLILIPARQQPFNRTHPPKIGGREISRLGFAAGPPGPPDFPRASLYGC